MEQPIFYRYFTDIYFTDIYFADGAADILPIFISPISILQMEQPIPEQFKTTLNGTKLNTVIAESV
jgi:hypothetical protein